MEVAAATLRLASSTSRTADLAARAGLQRARLEGQLQVWEGQWLAQHSTAADDDDSRAQHGTAVGGQHPGHHHGGGGDSRVPCGGLEHEAADARQCVNTGVWGGGLGTRPPHLTSPPPALAPF